MSRRKNFHGNVDPYETAAGVRYRVRARIDGTLKTLESGFVSRAAAEEFCRGYTSIRAKREVFVGLTLGQYGEGFFARREALGIRGVGRERTRWNKHIAGKSVGKIPLRSLRRSDVIAWRDELVAAGLRKGTQDLCLVLVRRALADALDRDLVAANVAANVKGVRDRQDVAKKELDGILLPDQQRHFLKTAPSERARRIAGLALLTGIRLSELRELRWEDVYLNTDHLGVTTGHLVIRRSERGLAPKSGLERRVELLPPAIAILQSIERVSRWVVTGGRGGQAAEGKAPCGVRTWSTWRRDAGLPIRWHDLRHTCATSLLAGWWGRRWSIEAVSKQLGHSSVMVTERYARKVADLTRSEARGMFQQSASDDGVEVVGVEVFIGANYRNRTDDLRVTNAQTSTKKTNAYRRQSIGGGTDVPMLALVPRQAPAEIGTNDHRHLTLPQWALLDAAVRMGVADHRRSA